MTKRVAFLFSGHIRTYSQCETSINNTIDMLEQAGYIVDSFAVMYPNQYGYHPFIKNLLNFHDDISIDTTVFKNLKGLQRAHILSSDDVDTQNFHHNMKDIYHGWSQYRSLFECVKLMHNYECEHAVQYDVCIKSRFDVLLSPCEIVKGVELCLSDSTSMIIPIQGHQPSDTTIISSKKIIEKLPSYVMDMYINPSSELCWTTPPHGLLQSYMNDNELKVSSLNISSVLRVNRDGI